MYTGIVEFCGVRTLLINPFKLVASYFLYKHSLTIPFKAKVLLIVLTRPYPLTHILWMCRGANVLLSWHTLFSHYQQQWCVNNLLSHNIIICFVCVRLEKTEGHAGFILAEQFQHNSLQNLEFQWRYANVAFLSSRFCMK